MSSVTDMPFDQYQRYRLVADILEEIRQGDAPLTILDVGGRTALLRRFLPDDTVHLVDVEPSGEAGLVLGTGAKLPFQDASFDAVVTFDTLEHVPPPYREAFVAECRRVTRDWVVIAGPYDTPGVAQAEDDLKRFLTEKLEVEHRYLNEHKENGLPSLEDTVSQLIDLGGQVSAIGHGNLERWLVLMCLSLYMDRDAPLRGMAARFHQFYNETLYQSDHASPVYRHAIVASFKNGEPPTARPILDPPVAPEGALERFRELAEELLVFDVKRDVWQREWDRLMEVNAGHLENLEGHEKRIAELESLKQDRDEVIATLEEDLKGHAERVTNLQAELSDVRADFEKSEREQEKVRTELEADLAEHKNSLAGARAELEETVERSEAQIAAHEATIDSLKDELAEHERQADALRGEVTALSEHREHLQAEVARLEGVAQEIQQALVDAQGGLAEQQAVIEEQQRLLAERDALLEHFRAELRSRKKNLKRALSWKKPEVR